MIIETELENALAAAFAPLLPADAALVRSRAAETEADASSCVVAVATGFRSHEAFSLPMISVAVNLTVATRIDRDPDGDTHEKVVEALSAKLERWHFKPNEFAAALALSRFEPGELRLTGGSGRVLSRESAVWTETLSFQIVGSEVFT